MTRKDKSVPVFDPAAPYRKNVGESFCVLVQDGNEFNQGHAYLGLAEEAAPAPAPDPKSKKKNGNAKKSTGKKPGGKGASKLSAAAKAYRAAKKENKKAKKAEDDNG